MDYSDKDRESTNVEDRRGERLLVWVALPHTAAQYWNHFLDGVAYGARYVGRALKNAACDLADIGCPQKIQGRLSDAGGELGAGVRPEKEGRDFGAGLRGYLDQQEPYPEIPKLPNHTTDLSPSKGRGHGR